MVLNLHETIPPARIKASQRTHNNCGSVPSLSVSYGIRLDPSSLPQAHQLIVTKRGKIHQKTSSSIHSNYNPARNNTTPQSSNSTSQYYSAHAHLVPTVFSWWFMFRSSASSSSSHTRISLHPHAFSDDSSCFLLFSVAFPLPWVAVV